MARGRAACRRARARRGRRDHRTSGRLRGLAARRGRADGPRLRPLRRPAGRPARPVDVAALRAGRRRPPDARPRRRRRQGPDPHPRHGRGRDPGDPGRLPGQRALRLRGRGGVERRAPRARGSRPTGTGCRRTSRSSATRASSRATSRRSPSSLRGIMYAQIDVVGGPVDLHSGGYGGVVENPANALARIITGAQGPGRADPHPRLLRRGRAADATRIARPSRPCRSTRRRYRSEPRRAGPGRRGGLHVARASRRPPDARCQRDLGRLTRATAPRRSSRPTPTPRSAAGSSRPRIRSGSSSCSAAYVDGHRAARRDHDRHLPRRRPAEPDAHRPSGDPGGRAGARGDIRPAARLHPRGRQHPGLCELRIDPRPAGRPARVHAARRPRPRPQRVDGPAQLRDRDPDGRPRRSTSSRRPSHDPPEVVPAVRRDTAAEPRNPPCADWTGPGG